MLRELTIVLMLLPAGCGAEFQGPSQAVSSKAESRPAKSSSDVATAAEKSAMDASVATRRIIYQADMQLVVQDFAVAEVDLPQLVKANGGYIADTNIDTTSGRQRSGRWEIRIPVTEFDSFLIAVTSLGIVEHRSQTAQDVTEEFVDLEARITNTRRLEQRILELLDKSVGKVTELIEVEQELARVRGEIEQMEGRLRYLTNRTDLTTVSVHICEQRDYVPPDNPTFAAKIHRAWMDSLSSVREAGEILAILVVSLTPWAVIAVVIGLPIVLWHRRSHSKSVTHNIS